MQIILIFLSALCRKHKVSLEVCYPFPESSQVTV